MASISKWRSALHGFNELDFHHDQSQVDGLEGVVDVYKKTLPIVTLHGPTEFREIVRLAANLAEPYKDPEQEEDMKY